MLAKLRSKGSWTHAASAKCINMSTLIIDLFDYYVLVLFVNEVNRWESSSIWVCSAVLAQRSIRS